MHSSLAKNCERLRTHTPCSLAGVYNSPQHFVKISPFILPSDNSYILIASTNATIYNIARAHRFFFTLIFLQNVITPDMFHEFIVSLLIIFKKYKRSQFQFFQFSISQFCVQILFPSVAFYLIIEDLIPVNKPLLWAKLCSMLNSKVMRVA